MKKKLIINPVGLKGNEINERMKELMGIAPINENKTTYVVELTKMGPDGKAYAIVRENHLYFIKVSDKKENLMAEDFKYIGGLKNKMEEAYHSYAKAIKQLNLKFRSLAEAYNYDGEINLFKNDNLISETAMAAGFAEMKGSGFSGHGNLEGNKSMHELHMTEEEAKNNPWAICTASVGREDKDKYESCVKDVKKQKGIDEAMTEEGWAEECWMRENMTDEEKAIDEMVAKEELHGGQKKLDVNKNGKLDADDFKQLRGVKEGEEEEEGEEEVPHNPEKPENQPGAITERRLSILKAIEKMDAIIDSLTEGEVKKKVKK